MIHDPEILILDEPTNHLDAESVAWLERFLKEYPGTVVAVTHDRYFLDNVAGWILELDRGRGIPWEGNYSSWLEQKEKRLEMEQKQEASRIKTMKAELEWVRTNPKGRHAKSKARLQRFEELSSKEHQKRNETQEIFIPVAERLGIAGLARDLGRAEVQHTVDLPERPAGRRHLTGQGVGVDVADLSWFWSLSGWNELVTCRNDGDARPASDIDMSDSKGHEATDILGPKNMTRGHEYVSSAYILAAARISSASTPQTLAASSMSYFSRFSR